MSVHVVLNLFKKLRKSEKMRGLPSIPLLLYNKLINSINKENDHRNYFKTQLHESMGPDWDQTHDPWIQDPAQNVIKQKYLPLGKSLECDQISLSV